MAIAGCKHFVDGKQVPCPPMCPCQSNPAPICGYHDCVQPAIGRTFVTGKVWPFCMFHRGWANGEAWRAGRRMTL